MNDLHQHPLVVGGSNKSKDIICAIPLRIGQSCRAGPRLSGPLPSVVSECTRAWSSDGPRWSVRSMKKWGTVFFLTHTLRHTDTLYSNDSMTADSIAPNVSLLYWRCGGCSSFPESGPPGS